jgi:hypothetical protein
VRPVWDAAADPLRSRWSSCPNGGAGLTLHTRLVRPLLSKQRRTQSLYIRAHAKIKGLLLASSCDYLRRNSFAKSLCSRAYLVFLLAWLSAECTLRGALIWSATL